MSGHSFIPFDRSESKIVITSAYLVYVVGLGLSICEFVFVPVFVFVFVFDHESGWRRECPSVRAPKSHQSMTTSSTDIN